MGTSDTKLRKNIHFYHLSRQRVCEATRSTKLPDDNNQHNQKREKINTAHVEYFSQRKSRYH